MGVFVRRVRLGLVLGLSILVSAGALGSCAEVQLSESVTSDTLEDKSRPPRICPAIAIRCFAGYVPKRLPNCNQICVPDVPAHERECTDDTDCGPIYCVTTPCEQPVCRGHQCVVPRHVPDQGGEPCGDNHCRGSSYCCNESCGICAPEGGACLQIACSPDYEE